LIATGEAKPRAGEQKLDAAPILEVRATANTATLGAVRKSVVMVRAAIDQIRNAFATRGAEAGLDNLAQLVGKIQAFIDPVEATKASAAEAEDATSAELGDPGPRSCAEARDALEAIADYYSRYEPSSPTLPLVRQAHQLIGKSFLEVIRILVPSHLEKAAFQIGGDRTFDLPIERLPNLVSEFSPSNSDFTPSHRDLAPSHHVAQSIISEGEGRAEGESWDGGEGQNRGEAERQRERQDHGQDHGGGQSQRPSEFSPSPTNVTSTRIQVSSRPQAVALLDQVQRYFRLSEPSSPVPMLCERARTFAERDFMAVLREVLPKAALRDIGIEK
jgi:type VI secretion system protein ImpA